MHRHSGAMVRLLAALALVCVASGCLTSHARYTRPSGAVIAKGTYRVPRNWDYRRDYRLPVSRLRTIVESYMGTPYRYGGTNRKGLDCSGLVYLVFRELNKAKMPRTTRRLKKLGRTVQRSGAKPGDLVFFALGRPGRLNHVCIYMGKGQFAHSSTSKGVIYSS